MTQRAICTWCGVFDDEHDRDVLATQCYPARIKAKVAEIERLRAALKPFADFADRTEYTLDDIDHGLFINAKLALRGLQLVKFHLTAADEQKASK